MDLKYTNYYLCSCGEHWENDHTGRRNENCAVCGTETAPYVCDDGLLTCTEYDACYDAMEAFNERSKASVVDVLQQEHTKTEETTVIVRCSRCGQYWNESDVPIIKFNAATVGETTGEGCDNCGTDKHLTDIYAGMANALGIVHQPRKFDPSTQSLH